MDVAIALLVVTPIAKQWARWRARSCVRTGDRDGPGFPVMGYLCDVVIVFNHFQTSYVVNPFYAICRERQ